jgi:hypothetical protein
MQTIVTMPTADPGAYAERQLERTARAPRGCPNCGQAGCLEAHGYYQRWVSDENGHPVRIQVRRFFLPPLLNYGELPAGVRATLPFGGECDD